MGLMFRQGKPQLSLASARVTADVLEHLVVHDELAHIKHHNHTNDFWTEVEKAYPQCRRATEWLRVNGAGRSF